MRATKVAISGCAAMGLAPLVGRRVDASRSCGGKGLAWQAVGKGRGAEDLRNPTANSHNNNLQSRCLKLELRNACSENGQRAPDVAGLRRADADAAADLADAASRALLAGVPQGQGTRARLFGVVL